MAALRKLASVQTVLGVYPIKGADRIERARVLGWDVVIGKGEFKPGDSCVFCEVDSLLPKADWCAFMEKRNWRVKTCKLRGVLSQGLAFPVSILEGPVPPAGTDVTEPLGITKWSPKPPKGSGHMGVKTGSPRPPRPGWIPKTDEIRVQSAPDVLQEIVQAPFHWTVKYDGTSASYAKRDGVFYACSRNYWYEDEDDSVYWDVARRLDLANKVQEGYCIQGEICGPKIQRNRLGLEENGLFAFDVRDISAARYLDPCDMRDFCLKIGVPTVSWEDTVIGPMLADFDTSLDAWLDRAKGVYPESRKRREGIVVRPLEGRYSEAIGGRMSFKVINNDYLLKDEQ